MKVIPLTRKEKEEEKRFLKQSVLWPALFVGLLWLVEAGKVLAKQAFGEQPSLTRFGVRPGSLIGLTGILFAPLIHDGWRHLFSNSAPLIALGSGILYLYRKVSLKVMALIWVLGGLGVWIIGRPSHHVGASGLVYGLLTFIFFSGIFRKEPPAIALSLVAVFLYGGIIWGIFPLEAGVSWEAHLSGAAVGAFLAFFYRKVDPPRRPEWEEEDEDYYHDDYDNKR